MFELLDAFSLPGNPAKPNEDAWAQSESAAVVLDGATGLGEALLPGESDAAWIAHFGARRLMAHFAQSGDPHAALKGALGDAEASFKGLRRRAPQHTYEIPFASMMFVAGTEDGFAALWFGDCAGLVARANAVVEIIGEAFSKRAAETRRVAMLASARNLAPAAGINRPEYLSVLRAGRNLFNTDEGGWLFAPDARAAEHAESKAVVAPQGTDVLLLSDGFLALASGYGAYTVESLVSAARAKGLEALGQELRAIEESDAEGRKFPRFKKSDDATAVLLRVV